MPIVPGTTEPVDDARGRAKRSPRRSATRSRSRPPAAAAARASASRWSRGQARGRVRGRRARGREVLLRRDRLPRALPARPAPRRGPGPRRRARQRGPPRRARLLDPAPPPEADRGVARAGSSTTSCASGSARSPPRRRAPSATAAPARSRACSQDGEYFFLEMNTRVQVEHCVTEVVTGDRHRARADPRSPPASRCRSPRTTSCCAATRSSAASTPRTPRRTSPPRPGTIAHYREPSGPGVRVDSGVVAGSEITPLYDPMVAKLIVWDVDREQRHRAACCARSRSSRSRACKTLIPFHKAIMATEQWANGRDLPRPDRGPRRG